MQLDSPSGVVDEYLGYDLVPESFVPTLQAEWDLGQAAWIHANKEPDEECDRCSSCAGTGIKDFAKRLAPASLREERIKL